MNLYPSSKKQKLSLPTSKPIRNLLPKFLKNIHQSCHERLDLIPLAWPEIIGENLAFMTRAEKFIDGILYVCVNNSTLLSLLSHRDKHTLLKKLRAKFPKTDIKEIRFRLG